MGAITFVCKSNDFRERYVQIRQFMEDLYAQRVMADWDEPDYDNHQPFRC